METKINIEEILKDKPQGTKLHDLLRNIDVYLDEVHITDIGSYIECTANNEVGSTMLFDYSKLGTEVSWIDGLQILIPSKEMRDWRKFSWKKGDVLVSNDSDTHIIFKGFSKSDYTAFEGKHWISVSKKRYLPCLNMQNTQDYHIEDDKDVAQTYINNIEEHCGGKLNHESLEIEKVQLKFKDGDIVVYGKSVAICRKIYKHTLYFYASITETFGLLLDDNCVSAEEYRFAKEEEKQQLFKALANEGKAWDAEKKMIVDLKSLWTPKPFDKVLVRNSDVDKWLAGFFEKFEKSWNNPYHIMNLHHMTDFAFKQCIPYEGNESLLGTTKDVKG